jgi:WD40 repeat protein
MSFYKPRTNSLKDYHQDWSLTCLSNGLLVSGGADGKIKLWDESAGIIQRTMNGHTGRIAALCVLENGFLVSCSTDKTVKIWNQLTGTLKTTLNGHLNSIETMIVLETAVIATGKMNVFILKIEIK